MKALLVNGSPHANGNTMRALEEVASALQTDGLETDARKRTPERASQSRRILV